MALDALIKVLDSHQLRYKIIRHSAAYSAREIRLSSYVHGYNLARVSVIRGKHENMLVVIPAHYRLLVDHLCEELGCSTIQVLKHPKAQNLFPGCDFEAIPPVSELWNMPVYIADVFTNNCFAMSAGTSAEVVVLDFVEYMSFEKPSLLTDRIVEPVFDADLASYRERSKRLIL